MEHLLVRREKLGAQDIGVRGRDAELFLEETGQQRRIQGQFLRGGQAERKAHVLPFSPEFQRRDIIFQLDDLDAFFALLLDRRALDGVVLRQSFGGGGRVADLVAGKGDEVGFHLHRLHRSNFNTGRHDGVQSRLPVGKIGILSLGLDVDALTLALLPQRQRTGKGHIDVRVEAQRMPDRESAPLQHALHDTLHVQQRDVGGFVLFLKRDSDCNQSRVLLTDGLRRSRGRHGCRAGWSGRREPCYTHAQGIRG